MRIELVLSIGVAGAILGMLWFLLTPSSREVIYKSLETGEALIAVIHEPARIRRPRGTLVFFHGGGWYTGSPRGRVSALGRALAAKGYRFVAPQYRVYGRDHTGIETALQDARDAVVWAQPQFAAEGKAVFAIGGGSAGGHLAALVALELDASTISHLVLMNPVLDLTSATPETGFSSGELMLIGQLSARRQGELSPLHRVAEFPMPVLTAYGDLDPLWLAYRHTLTEAALRTEIFVGESHGFFNQASQRSRVVALVQEFLDPR